MFVSNTDIVITEDTIFDLVPDKIKVLHSIYDLDMSPKVKEMLDYKSRLGEVSFQDEVIRIAKQSGPATADTIIHELIHVIWHMFDLDNPQIEEHMVLTLSTGITTIMKDNPDLFPALQLLVDEG